MREIFFIFVGGGLKVGVFLGIPAEQILIRHDFGAREKHAEFGVPFFQLVKPREKPVAHLHCPSFSFLSARSILSVPCMSLYTVTAYAPNISFSVSA